MLNSRVCFLWLPPPFALKESCAAGRAKALNSTDLDSNPVSKTLQLPPKHLGASVPPSSNLNNGGRNTYFGGFEAF